MTTRAKSDADLIREAVQLAGGGKDAALLAMLAAHAKAVSLDALALAAKKSTGEIHGMLQSAVVRMGYDSRFRNEFHRLNSRFCRS